MPRIIKEESIADLIQTGPRTIELAPSVVNFRATQYGNSVNVNLDLNTVGLGGLDTGSPSSLSEYAIYYIPDVPTNGACGIVASLDGNSPSGFPNYIKIGVCNTDGSSNISLVQTYRTFLGSEVGEYKAYAGATLPSGYLYCAGQEVSRTIFDALFLAIGTTYGVGNGSTTFNLPDLRGRVLAGKDNMGGTAVNRLTSGASGVDGVTLGASGGSQTHTLTMAQMPSHNHGGGNHDHSSNMDAILSGVVAGAGVRATGLDNGTVVINFSGTIINTEGSGGAHQNTQPTLISNYIIKF